MREAKPEENGIIFKSLHSRVDLGMSTFDQSSEVVPVVSMMSKDLPGSEDIQVLIRGLKHLDDAFRQKVEIVQRLTLGHESLVQNVAEVEDSVQKLKYLTLHSIQLPVKPTASPK
jgi:hypothetical protein